MNHTTLIHVPNLLRPKRHAETIWVPRVIRQKQQVSFNEEYHVQNMISQDLYPKKKKKKKKFK